MLRLIVFIVVFAVFLVFIVFNLDNKCNISFGFKTLADVPVFLTAFSSFVLGMLFTLPFAVSSGKRRKKGFDAGASHPSNPRKFIGFRGKKDKNAQSADAAAAKDGAVTGTGEVK